MNKLQKTVAGMAMVGATLTGGAIGAALVTGAGAQTTSTTAAASQPAPPGGDGQGRAFDPSKGGHVGANGATETLLTGDTAEKVKAAALAAVPGGTIQRVETDAEGSPYEAHMTDASGKPVTVKVDKDFKVTGTESGGPGAGGPGGGGHGGHRGSATTPTTTAA
jgi:hypothetical protein